MQTLLYLDIDPTILAELLRVLSVQGEMLAIRAGQDARSLGAAARMADEVTLRTHLTACGLIPRQCDLVVLDVQGRSRTDIAEISGISPATVKKYWAAIYARLGVASRPILRAWVRTQLAHRPEHRSWSRWLTSINACWRCDPTPANDRQRTCKDSPISKRQRGQCHVQ